MLEVRRAENTSVPHGLDLGGMASGLYYTYHRGTKLAQTGFTPSYGAWTRWIRDVKE